MPMQSGTEYYNSDVLNESGCWVWVDHADSICGNDNCYDILAARDTLYDLAAEKSFGIRKAFVRSGCVDRADGNDFLQCYSRENIDALELNWGIAMAYTHLNFGWLDLETRTMRETIRERLAYLRKKNGWFTTASSILDRFHAMREIDLIESDK
jgi:hypothetical protein